MSCDYPFEYEKELPKKHLKIPVVIEFTNEGWSFNKMIVLNRMKDEVDDEHPDSIIAVYSVELSSDAVFHVSLTSIGDVWRLLEKEYNSFVTFDLHDVKHENPGITFRVRRSKDLLKMDKTMRDAMR